MFHLYLVEIWNNQWNWIYFLVSDNGLYQVLNSTAVMGDCFLNLFDFSIFFTAIPMDRASGLSQGK